MRSQEELQRLLARRGFEATQPTLSRDVRDLGLVKTPRGYALPGAVDPADDAQRRLGRLERVLAESVVSVRVAGTLVVLKTPPAGAHPVARVLDEAGLPEADRNDRRGRHGLRRRRRRGRRAGARRPPFRPRGTRPGAPTRRLKAGRRSGR